MHIKILNKCMVIRIESPYSTVFIIIFFIIINESY